MTSTTHVTASCVITATAIQWDISDLQKFILVTLAAFIAHFIFDIAPHGYIATPHTLFKKILPTTVELFPGPLILLGSNVLFGNPFLFMSASLCGVLPDIVTVLFYKQKEMISSAPPLRMVHSAHRKIHWFETEHPDGTVTFPFPNGILLTLELLLIIFLVIILYVLYIA
jgi:hypothetical protein